MRIGTGLGELQSETRRQTLNMGKNRPKNPRSSPAVQRLYDACKGCLLMELCPRLRLSTTFDRFWIKDDMDLNNVGLSENMPCFRLSQSRGVIPITYVHLHECDKFSICVFCLPPGGIIPLHNHPGMTVFSKLLFGSMHIKSYDWVDASQFSGSIIHPFDLQASLLAKLQTDAVFTVPCRTSVLYHTDGGNMHCFTAISACAVLDVLGPPYSTPEEGRDCTYYHDFSYGNNSELADHDDAAYAWLAERDKPEDFVVIGAKYRVLEFYGARILW